VIDIAHTWDGQPLGASDVARVGWQLDEAVLRIWVDAPFHDDPPPPGPPGPTPGLWNHEVVELFLVGAGPHYTEIELSPHGHHLVLRLEGVRQAVASELPLQLAARREATRWQAEAVLSRSLLPDDILSFNAFRIHGVGAHRRYLAHAPVPGPMPDFHRLGLFPRWPGPSTAS